MSNDKPFFLSHNQALGTVSARDEYLHPEENRLVTSDSATETQYFGFSIPEERIHAIGYLWHHPNLKTLSGGIFVWRGIKPNNVYSELSDVRTFMSDAALKGDLHEYRMDNGYGVKVVEPLKRHHLTYSDPSRNNHVDLHYAAVMQPVMFGDGKHFEQPVKVTGELILRGTRYEVDCYSVRDRSWGRARPEDNIPMPPYSWLTGVFGPDFAFNCGVFDQAGGNPDLKPPFVLPLEKTLAGGWVNRAGRLGRIVKVTKRVVRAPITHLPMQLDFVVVDEFDRSMEIRGTLLAANCWQVWSNIHFVICLMRWECEGLVAYGDCQEAFWNDYLIQNRHEPSVQALR